MKVISLIAAAILSLLVKDPIASVSFSFILHNGDNLVAEGLKYRAADIPIDGAFYEPYSLSVNEAMMFIVFDHRLDLTLFLIMGDNSQKKLMNDTVQDNYGDYIGCEKVKAVVIHDRKKYAELETGYGTSLDDLEIKHFDGEEALVVVQDKTTDCYRDYYDANQVFYPTDSSDPQDSVGWNAKGDELYNKGNYEEALKCYEKAIKLSPEPNAFYYYNKGASLNFLGMYQEAVMAYDEAIKLSPHYIDAMQNKSDSLNMLRRYDESQKCLDEALKIDGENAGLYCSYGNIYFYESEYQKAVQYYDKAAEKDFSYATAHHNKGYALFYLGQYEDALLSFDIYIGINGDDAEVYYQEAMAYSLLDQGDIAVSYLDKAIELDISYIGAARNESNFDNIRNMLEFIKMIGQDNDL